MAGLRLSRLALFREANGKHLGCYSRSLSIEFQKKQSVCGQVTVYFASIQAAPTLHRTLSFSDLLSQSGLELSRLLDLLFKTHLTVGLSSVGSQRVARPPDTFRPAPT